MRLAIRDATSRIAEAAAAAAAIIKHGRPVVKLVPACGVSGFDADRAAAARRALGLDGVVVRVSLEYDDSGFSRAVLGQTDRGACWTRPSRSGRRPIRRRRRTGSAR